MGAGMILWASSFSPAGRQLSDVWHAFDLRGYNDGSDAVAKCGEAVAHLGQAVGAGGAFPGGLCPQCQDVVRDSAGAARP